MLSAMMTPIPISFRIQRFLRRLAIQLPIILVLYVLSIGPMYWYWFEAYHLGGSTFIAKLYLPLLIVCKKVDFISDWVNWYIGLWIL